MNLHPYYLAATGWRSAAKFGNWNISRTIKEPPGFRIVRAYMEVDELQRALKPSQEQAINLTASKNITAQNNAAP